MSGGLPLDLIQQGCTESLITAVYGKERNFAIPALMNMGKTYGAVKAAHNAGKEVTICEPRTEKYADLVEDCEHIGLSAKVLPAFDGKNEQVERAYCPTASGEYDNPDAETPVSEKVKNQRARGVSPIEIHENFEDEHGYPIPCQEHRDCPYLRAMRELQPENYDVLIGHYSHAFVERFVEDRIVVIDEFPAGAYVNSLAGDVLRESVFQWAKDNPELPFDSLDELTGGALSENDIAASNKWFGSGYPQRDSTGLTHNRRLFADTPLAVYTLLNGTRLDNGLKYCELGNGRTGVYNPRVGRKGKLTFYLLNRPNFDAAEQVVALDGTFDKTMWKLATGIEFEVENVLDEKRRESYIKDTLGYHIYRISIHSRPTSGGRYTDPERVRLIRETIEDTYDTDLAFIGSYGDMYKHETNLAEADVLPKDSHNREDVIGSGMFENHNLGLIWGSNHFGDDYVKMWSALGGESASRNKDVRNPDYGSLGNRVVRWMRESLTAQELFRIGRDRSKSVIYVYTAHTPEWLPINGTGEVFRAWSKGARNVVEVLRELDGDRHTEPQIRNQTEIKQSQTNKCLRELSRAGFIEQVETSLQTNIWRDKELEKFDPKGFVDLTLVHTETPSLPTTDHGLQDAVEEGEKISSQ